jgi:hypothetical protein
MKKEDQEKLDFYLDAYEVLNKPRRIFMGLEMQIKVRRAEYSKEERALAIEIIKEAEKDFYKNTLPKFEDKIRALN